MSDGPKISQRYRELPREEPPRALDAAILAASRRAVRSRRWYFPVAAAAVIVLSVAVVVHMDRERPDNEFAVSSGTVRQPPSPSPVDERKAEAAKPEAPKAEAPRVAARPRADEAPRAQRREPQPFAGMPGRSESAGAPAQAPAAPAAREEQNDVAASRAPAPQSATTVSASARISPSPKQWLQRIADLRREGRHEEADRELAEFRKQYPDHRLSDEMKARVERR